jgi:murein peptide amidase A
VLRALTLVAVVALAGGPEAERRFENRVYGHTVLVPAGWTARVGPESGQTNLATYPGAPLDGYGRPPAGHMQLILADYGRAPCPTSAIPDGEPVRLGPRVSFEGFVGYNVSFCRRGHVLQTFIPAGARVSARRLEEARGIVDSVRLTRRADEIANVHSMRQLGRSVEGRPIRAWRIGNPEGKRRILVVGCIHGDECAGMRVAQQLVNLLRPIAGDLWVIQNLNPDGIAHGTRGHARGVDLNRDFLAATQRETQIARKLILRLRPDVTIWFHQPQAVVRAWGGSRAAARRYATLAGARYRSLEWPPGSASRWQNGIGQVSFVVELPAGELPHAAALRHARAVLRLTE